MKSDEVEIGQITAENSLDIPLVPALSNSEENPAEVRSSNSKIALSFLCSVCLICIVVAWPSGVLSVSSPLPRQLFLPAVRVGVRAPPQPLVMQGKASNFPVQMDDDEDVGPQPGDDEPPILPAQVQMMMRMGGVKASDFPTPVLRTRPTKPLASKNGKNGLLLGRREFAAASVVGGASLLSGARPALADTEMQEGATGKAEMLSNEDAKKALDDNPGLGLLGSAEITAFYEKLCRETADKSKDKSDEDVQKLRQQIAYDTRRLIEQGNIAPNLNQVLKAIETQNNPKQYDEMKVAAQEALDLLIKILESSSDRTFFGTKSELLRYADGYKGSRDKLFLVFSALPIEEQDRLYEMAKTLPFAQEFEQDIGKLSRGSPKK